MIHVNGLTFTYPRQTRPALQRVTLSIGRGEIVLVAGPSGSGKSTLLRCLNGLVPHFSGGQLEGSVVVNGQDVVALGPTKMSRSVGFVFQNPEAQAVLDVVEAELAFGLENAGLPEAEMEARVSAVLENLRLTELRHRRLSTLSGGERQRLALATALVMAPDLLVLDEPTSQLDPQAAAEFLDLLVAMCKELGLTVVMSEHRLERVLPYVDRLVVLDSGRLAVNGPPAQVADRLDEKPPVTALGLALGWQPVPLSVAGATGHLASLPPTRAPEPPRPGPHAPLLEVDRVSASHQDGTVLHDVSLSVGEGELVALVGPNGAGKTTLLRAIVGLNHTTSGDIRLARRSLTGLPVIDRCRRIAYLPQNPDDLLFAETVEDELAQTLRNHGLEPEELSVSPQALLLHLGLGDRRTAYPRDLSVGERQRVAFGTVAVTGPRLLLLDEPTRGLDATAKNELIRLCRWWLDQSAGMLLVTHDVELVAGAADRVILLEDGRVTADGPPATVFRQRIAFAPQLTRLDPARGWLTLRDALAALEDVIAVGPSMGPSKD